MDLKPVYHPAVQNILEKHSDLLFQLSDAHRSVIHVLLPEIFIENAESFKEVLRKADVNSRIAYAAKANKGQAFLEAAAKTGIGLDASSLYELRAALDHGIKGENIGISGPMKEERLLLLSLQHGATISVDSIEELHNIEKICEGAGIGNAKILIRVNDLSAKQSRFGVPKEQLPEIYKFLSVHPKIKCKGFCFHLDGYSVDDRVNAINAIVEEVREARKQGIECEEINIGGGFTVQYLDEQTWNEFQQSGKDDFYAGKQFPGFYPYHTPSSKEKFLESILEHPIGENRKKIKDVLNDENLKLAIEPGRALLDQAGFTLMKVKGVKKVANGESMVMVDANMNHLSELWFNTQFLPDPIMLRRSGIRENKPFTASIAGNTCMEMDMISWRKICFPSEPVNGDLIAYINTAGYQMDTNETDFHQIPIPPKVVMFKDGGGYGWRSDPNFSLLDLKP